MKKATIKKIINEMENISKGLISLKSKISPS